MSDRVVFRSNEPDVIEAFDLAMDAYNAWHDNICDFASSIHPDAKPMVSSAWGQKSLSGISYVNPIPEGWRLVKRMGCLVPHRSLKAGKSAAALMDLLKRAPDVRAMLPGMPSGFMYKLNYCSVGLEELDGYIYASFSHDPADEYADMGWNHSDARKVDFNLWERVKLSEYYALRESETEVAS